MRRRGFTPFGVTLLQETPDEKIQNLERPESLPNPFAKFLVQLKMEKDLAISQNANLRRVNDGAENHHDSDDVR